MMHSKKIIAGFVAFVAVFVASVSCQPFGMTLGKRDFGRFDGIRLKKEGFRLSDAKSSLQHKNDAVDLRNLLALLISVYEGVLHQDAAKENIESEFLNATPQQKQSVFPNELNSDYSLYFQSPIKEETNTQPGKNFSWNHPSLQRSREFISPIEVLELLRLAGQQLSARRHSSSFQ